MNLKLYGERKGAWKFDGTVSESGDRNRFFQNIRLRRAEILKKSEPVSGMMC